MTTASISVAFRVSSQDTEALINGRSITIMPLRFMRFGQQFALYPDRPEQSESKTVLIRAWARCELCQNLYESQSVDVLAQLLNLSPEELSKIFSERGHIFLAYLRVYLLPQPIEIPINPEGQFVPLPQNFYFSDDSPVLSDRTFTTRKRHLENLEPLDVQICETIEDVEYERKLILDEELAWIKTISTLGDRSIEQDQERSSNYQAGTDFENISKKSLEFLGFTIDEAYKGGAGGLDLFCSKPYSLAGECKAGRKIPDRAVEQLDRIAKRHLQEEYLSAYRLIIGSGEPTRNLKESAIQSRISIIKAMTLQKLVELKARYDGAINLFELKEHLKLGQIDTAIDEYIQKVENRIRLRSHIVNLIKNHHEEKVGVEALFGAYPYSTPLQPISNRGDLHEILIELSSPLTGYLGREKGNDWESDRFYFLRDLPTEKEP